MADLAQHIVRSYEQELQQLRDMLVEMGGLLEAQLATATAAVTQGDSAAATAAMEQDPAVDALERDVEQFVIRLLALRQPLAGDLRQIVASLKISSDLERIGDYAANVAKRSIVLNQFNLSFKLSGLAHMARQVQENLKLTIDAVGDSDAEKAVQVWRADQAVDDIYTAIFRATSRPARICSSLQKIWNESVIIRPISPRQCTMPLLAKYCRKDAQKAKVPLIPSSGRGSIRPWMP
jgi:phosphate transport system protein